MSDPLSRLIGGFESFKTDFIHGRPDEYRSLVERGQRPEALVVACSDSRVDPAIMTKADPGDLFILRNVAAIVPPYEKGHRPKGSTSALEFGVRGLEVKHIVVLGHGRCGGIRLLALDMGLGGVGEATGRRFEFLHDWMGTIDEAGRAVAGGDLHPEIAGRILEQAGVLTSLNNLLTFPWITARVARGQLTLHGWYFDLEAGELLAYDARRRRFAPVREVPFSIDAELLDDRLALDPREFVAKVTTSS